MNYIQAQNYCQQSNDYERCALREPWVKGNLRVRDTLIRRFIQPSQHTPPQWPKKSLRRSGRENSWQAIPFAICRQRSAGLGRPPPAKTFSALNCWFSAAKQTWPDRADTTAAAAAFALFKRVNGGKHAEMNIANQNI